jgi:YgiT-type zinc finger domain-containing protein
MTQPFPPKALDKYPAECTTCGGPVEEVLITLVLPPRNHETRIVDGVPAGVCASCGEEFLQLRTLEALERVLANPPARREEVPVWEFAALRR